MNRRRKDGMPTGALIALVIIAALLCAVLLAVMYMDRNGMIGGKDAARVGEDASGADADNSYEEGGPGAVKADAGKSPDEADADKSQDGTDMQGSPDEDADALIPKDKTVDIASLAARNPDIYAWLYIPMAGIDEPVLQSSENINYYVDHDADGNEDSNGAVFTQELNSKDFNDNLTVIYGHNSGDDKGFSNLKVFSDPGYFAEYPYIYVYTEDKILVYQVFAAYESDDKLIVMFYGTQDDELYWIYLSNIEENAGLDARLDKTIWPGPQDKTITLSTGVEGKEDRRFLVQAKLIRSQPLK